MIRNSTITPRVLRTAEAAEYIGMSPALFKREIAGKLKPLRLVDTIVGYDVRDLDKLVDDSKESEQDGGCKDSKSGEKSWQEECRGSIKKRPNQAAKSGTSTSKLKAMAEFAKVVGLPT